MRPFLPTVVAVLLVASVSAQGPVPSISEHTRGMEARQGFLSLHWEAGTGKMWLEIPALDQEFLYSVSLATGLGSNPVGLDRGSLAGQHVVEFQRSGPRILLVAKNYRFRATTDNLRERAAVADSFAPSVLWGFEIAAEEKGRILVDATDFLLRDSANVVGRLKRADQGAYELERSRSAFFLPRTKAFPDNTEVEVTLTFVSESGGRLVSRVAATGDAVTLRQHVSFVLLPDDDYTPRRFDPRVGYSAVTFADYGTPIGEPLEQQWITRHRLQKRDPGAAVSEPVEPIVYYLDPGAPEPVRGALLEGASWWSAAFEAAGFKNAFRVAVLPDGVDPMDVRYNVIHWVHRSTRGWSYGGSVRDPRTGEILKGNVLLGSLRVRQDHLKLVGLHGPHDGCAAAMSPGASHLIPGMQSELAEEVALARIRQLAAHEVGHTLGLSHNFAASGYGRASVMDYPAPMVELGDGGKLDFSKAYAVGIGEYDKMAIRFGYAQFALGADEAAELQAIIGDGLGRGFVFLTDQDARAASTGNPLAALWDNGSDPVARLRHEMRVRRIGLDQFGPDALREGRALAELEEVLVPLYLHHRFQLEAALKVVGGVDYRHAVKGDGQPQPVAARRQREALSAVLETLSVSFLSQGIDAGIPPARPGHSAVTERFDRYTGGPFDPMAMVAVCAGLTVSGLLERHRAARLLSPLQRAGSDLDLVGVADALMERTFRAQMNVGPNGRAIQRLVQTIVVDELMGLAGDSSALPEARAVARQVLADLEVDLEQTAAGTGDDLAKIHLHATVRRIHFFLLDPRQATRRVEGVAAPPGSPIGAGKH